MDHFPFLTNLRTESRVPGGPLNCLPVRTAAGGGCQEPTPHTSYDFCKHLTEETRGGRRWWQRPGAACSRSEVTPGSLEEPCQRLGSSPGLWFQSNQVSGCSFFFFF